jgi:transcriptional regulator with XRE-family HTH domain
MAHIPGPLNAEYRFMDHVKEIREARGLSQARIAQAMSALGFKLHQTAIAKMEVPDVGQRRALRLSEALALAEILGENLGDLLGNTVSGDGERLMELDQAVKDAEDTLRLAQRAYADHLRQVTLRLHRRAG